MDPSTIEVGTVPGIETWGRHLPPRHIQPQKRCLLRQLAVCGGAGNPDAGVASFRTQQDFQSKLIMSEKGGSPDELDGLRGVVVPPKMTDLDVSRQSGSV